MKIYSKVLSKREQHKLEKICLDVNFPWFYLHDTAFSPTKSKRLKSQQDSFSHLLYRRYDKPARSAFLHLFQPYLKTISHKINLDYEKIIRVRLGMYYPRPHAPAHNNPHVDDQRDHMTVIYYVNQSTGNTFLFSEKPPIQITPQQGKLVIFKGHVRHASSDPKDKLRITLNINYAIEKY